MDHSINDPLFVRGSVKIYCLLLTGYPPDFRREYGHHLVQVFRDCCLRALRREGHPGIFSFWSLILIDLLKTALEENLQRGVSMTRSSFTRLSGWALATGAIALVIGFYGSSRPSPYDPSNYLSHPLDAWLLRSAPVLIPASLLLLALGMAGLWAKTEAKIPGLGRFFLLAGAVSGLVSMAASFGVVASLDGLWWVFFSIGLLVYFVCLALFGILALIYKPFRQFQFLPLFTGVWAPLIVLLQNWFSLPESAGMIFVILSCAGLLLLGLQIQSESQAVASTTS